MGLLRRKPKPPPPKQRPFRRGKGPLAFYRLVPARMGPRDLLSPMRQLRSRAFARGAAGNDVFGGIFLFLIGARAFREASRRKPRTLALDKLEPGQGIRIITAKPPKGGIGKRERQQGLPT